MYCFKNEPCIYLILGGFIFDESQLGLPKGDELSGWANQGVADIA
jgi:hypothetical protein